MNTDGTQVTTLQITQVQKDTVYTVAVKSNKYPDSPVDKERIKLTVQPVNPGKFNRQYK